MRTTSPSGISNIRSLQVSPWSASATVTGAVLLLMLAAIRCVSMISVEAHDVVRVRSLCTAIEALLVIAMTTTIINTLYQLAVWSGWLRAERRADSRITMPLDHG